MWAGGFDFASSRLSPAVKQRQELPTPNKNEQKATSPTKPLCELPVTVPSVPPKKAAPVAHDMTTDEFAESDVEVELPVAAKPQQVKKPKKRAMQVTAGDSAEGNSPCEGTKKKAARIQDWSVAEWGDLPLNAVKHRLSSKIWREKRTLEQGVKYGMDPTERAEK